ncbi:hypothetical protein J3A84_05090 [Proteiniclasticum sp. SCR006]|uniref:MFS transporter n=1 Tax=Proteiniclasticum aestuarii TaxID=2817862 RepID=A0A939H9X5_9CLOT|nr:hypothetical protein [Proteiniclasticum aestuarii]MBO1264415.1 hypothetical protein [Proteiniclasticum aestuarii]
MVGSFSKTLLFMMMISAGLSQTVTASEEVAQASIGNASDVYFQAFCAAMATLLVVFVLWAIIFRPKFKSSAE